MAATVLDEEDLGSTVRHHRDRWRLDALDLEHTLLQQKSFGACVFHKAMGQNSTSRASTDNHVVIASLVVASGVSALTQSKPAF